MERVCKKLETSFLRTAWDAALRQPQAACRGRGLAAEATHLVAMLVTLSLLGYAAALALAAVDWIQNGRSGWRTALGGSFQHAGTAIALIAVIYRNPQVAVIGLLLVTLGLVLAGLHRRTAAPRFEAALTILTITHLVSLTVYYAA